MVYWIGGVLFQKSFDVQPELTHPDFNCNTETYCDGDFVELECLAPLTCIAPGSSTTLTETWQIYDSLKQPFISDKLRGRLKIS